MNKIRGFKIIIILLGMSLLVSAIKVNACGGFFCQIAPINQSGEQIIFRQDGSDITTMVRIFYSGNAEDFAWVLPVPNTPELSIGSDLTFTELEFATRPQFNLERTGQVCSADNILAFPLPVGSTADLESGADPKVVIEQKLEVGPFDAQIISSESSTALSQWLADNNFDLSERGEELLEPYITASMKFVVLKLQSDKTSGDIQPLILKYQGEKPMIPLRLTAVAAEDDMGVFVWVLGQNRAVPDNFLHVTPNYTRLNWYTGSFNAYASYQSLITDAMNEAGGQGFATDLAEKIENLQDNLTTSESFTQLLNDLSSSNDADFINRAWISGLSNTISNTIVASLPLPEGQNVSVYSDSIAIATQFTAQQLTSARAELIATIQSQLIDPLDNAIDILDDDLYLTRLYTTLSADEMLVDPTFVFNSDMPNQARQRNATLDAQCVNERTSWTLTLGEGTGREDSVVITGDGPLPISAQADTQKASWQIAKTSSSGLPDVQQEQNFPIVDMAPTNQSSGSGSLGSLFAFFLLCSTLLKVFMFRVRTHEA